MGLTYPVVHLPRKPEEERAVARTARAADNNNGDGQKKQKQLELKDLGWGWVAKHLGQAGINVSK